MLQPAPPELEPGSPAAVSAALLVLSSADLLECILRQCNGDRQRVLRVLSEVCHDCRQACDQVLLRRSPVELVGDVRVVHFRSTFAGVRGWARRFMAHAAAARLGVWCLDAWDQPHLHNTLLFNSAAAQAAGPGLRCLDLRLPHLLAPLVDRVFVPPARMEGLTSLSLQLAFWEEAEEGSAAERLRRSNACTTAAALRRSFEALTSLQSLTLDMPCAEPSHSDLAQVAPSLPPALTSLEMAVVAPPGRPSWPVNTRSTLALADLAHLRHLQHLRLRNLLSASQQQTPPPALAAALTCLEVEHQGDSCLGDLLCRHSAMPALRSLRLCGCQLDVAAAAAAAPALQSLTLSQCKFSGPPQFSRLAALTRLALERPLRNWDGTWTLHGSLQGLTALLALEAALCPLQHGAAALPPLPQLTSLRLNKCILDAPLCLSGLPQLRDFQLRSFWYTALPALADLAELRHLTRLCLRTQAFWDAPRLRLEQLEELTELAVLEPASLAPSGWRPPKAPPPLPADAGAAEAGGDGNGSDSDSYPGSSYDSDDDWIGEVDSEDEQWEVLTGLNRFFNT